MKKSGDGRRVARMEHEVLRLIAQYMIAKLRDELPAIITVTRVIMPADLRSAKVYVSALNLTGSFKQVLEILKEHTAEIQRSIGDHLQARYCPKLQFFEDDTTEKVLKIEGIMRDLSSTKKSEQN